MPTSSKENPLLKTRRETSQKSFVLMIPKVKAVAELKPQQRKVKGTLHWVTQKDALKAKVRLYDRLFHVPAPDQDKVKGFQIFYQS